MSETKRTEKPDSGGVTRAEKYAWLLLGVAVLFCAAWLSSAPWRHRRKIENSLFVPRWNIRPAEDYTVYDETAANDAVILVSGRADFIHLADFCESNPQFALEIVRSGLKGGTSPETESASGTGGKVSTELHRKKVQAALTAASLCPLLIAHGLRPDDLEPLADMAVPDPDDLKAARAGKPAPEAAERLTVNQLAANLLERLIIVEKSAGDGHLYAVLPAENGGAPKKVRGKWLLREGIDDSRRGSVRFESLEAEAAYYKVHIRDLVPDRELQRKLNLAPGTRKRPLDFFVLPAEATAKTIDN